MKKKAALFPGQGSASVGMGKTLCAEYSAARETFEEAGEAISVDLKRLCFAGDSNELGKTENAQPAILTASVAAYRVLRQKTGFHPQFFAGHSLGEFSALTCAGAISFPEAVRLVRKRGELMAKAAGNSCGVMTAVGKIPKEYLIDICKELNAAGHAVCVSNYNSPKQNVISGSRAAVEAAEKELSEMGAMLKRLNVSAPFHSPLMQPAAEEFRQVLKYITFTEPSAPVLSNVTARPHRTDEIVEMLSEQIVSPVRWQESMEYLKDQRIRLAVELGPGKVLRNLMYTNFPSVKALSYDEEDDAQELEILIKQDKTIPYVSRCMGLAVSAPNQCMDHAYYREHVALPYEKLQKMQESLEAQDREAAEDERQEARELLLEILRSKQTKPDEIERRMSVLAFDTGIRVTGK